MGTLLCAWMRCIVYLDITQETKNQEPSINRCQSIAKANADSIKVTVFLEAVVRRQHQRGSIPNWQVEEDLRGCITPNLSRNTHKMVMFTVDIGRSNMILPYLWILQSSPVRCQIVIDPIHEPIKSCCICKQCGDYDIGKQSQKVWQLPIPKKNERKSD